MGFIPIHTKVTNKYSYDKSSHQESAYVQDMRLFDRRCYSDGVQIHTETNEQCRLQWFRSTEEERESEISKYKIKKTC